MAKILLENISLKSLKLSGNVHINSFNPYWIVGKGCGKGRPSFTSFFFCPLLKILWPLIIAPLMKRTKGLIYLKIMNLTT